MGQGARFANTKMRFRIKGHIWKAIQSSIDVAIRILVDRAEQDFDHKRQTYGGRFLVRRTLACSEWYRGGGLEDLEDQN